MSPGLNGTNRMLVDTLWSCQSAWDRASPILELQRFAIQRRVQHLVAEVVRLRAIRLGPKSHDFGYEKRPPTCWLWKLPSLLATRPFMSYTYRGVIGLHGLKPAASF